MDKLKGVKKVDCERYYCGDCIHHKIGKGGKYLPCKRIDHDLIKFAIPWFKSYDGNQHSGTICADFYLKPYMIYALKHWKGFQEYWEAYVKEWLPYSNTDTLIHFTLHNDTSIRYGIRLMDFVNGTMIEGNTLKAVEKVYYKKSQKSSIGYVFIREAIDSVEIVKGGRDEQSIL